MSCKTPTQHLISELDAEYLRQVDRDWEEYENEMECVMRDRFRYERNNKVTYDA